MSPKGSILLKPSTLPSASEREMARAWHQRVRGAMSELGVRRDKRRFPVGASPTRQPLQPEAIGAVMEVTKWLKPSISVSRIGDSASVQAATRVNAEQALYGAFEVKHIF